MQGGQVVVRLSYRHGPGALSNSLPLDREIKKARTTQETVWQVILGTIKYNTEQSFQGTQEDAYG